MWMHLFGSGGMWIAVGLSLTVIAIAAWSITRLFPTGPDDLTPAHHEPEATTERAQSGDHPS